MKALAVFLTCIFATASQQAYGALTYRFSFVESYFNGLPGNKVGVDLVLTETATAGEQLRFFSSTDGLTSFGPLIIDYAPIAPATNVLSIASPADVTINPIFPDTPFNRILNIDNGNFQLEIGGVTTVGGIKAPVNQPSFEVLLASIQFTVVGNLGDTARIKGIPNALGNVFFDSDFQPADNVAGPNYGNAVFYVSAVPEPSGLAVVGLLCGVVACRRKRAVVR